MVRYPGSGGDLIRNAFPIGNGRLGAMAIGSPGSDRVVLNIDSLWTGGPFMSSSYNGGNPSSAFKGLASIRSNIFAKGTGSVDGLLGGTLDYGSYTVFGNLTIGIDGVRSGSSYKRSLDLDTGIHTTTYAGGDGNTYTITMYCSYPDSVCVVVFESSSTLPTVTIGFENQALAGGASTSCGAGFARMSGSNGMMFDGIARLSTAAGTSSCSGGNLVVPSSSKLSTFNIVISANTNYDQTKGNSASGFSFKGVDPSAYVESTSSAAAAKTETALRQAHLADYQGLTGLFTLDLPDAASSSTMETSALMTRYSGTGPGDPYLESLLFDFGRHLFIASTRDNSLPPNLQGRWTHLIKPSWGSDYHANINFQMNHWGVDQTGIGELQKATFNYMQNTWVPRGTETAQLLYGGQGWVTHDEMNIFGHTAMKNSAQWADYPASAAWMMQHVFDHYSYSQDATWYESQGYPLLKGVAQFWLSQLQTDAYSKDGTLVVNPCNSPEHGPTTFGCLHYQQLIYQLLVNMIGAASALTTPDTSFISTLSSTLTTLDKGLHIGTWGEIKEWKLPDSAGYDFKNDTHRHLSNLYGWYPGYSISSFQGGYADKSIQNAVATTLWSRGNGTGTDANAGWEKVWRSACWARLNETERAYFELRYAIDINFANNGLSMYGATSKTFQIDANFGMMGAVLSMLIVDLPAANGKEGRTVVLGPAIPSRWGGGSVTGMRLRGGGNVDYSWDSTGLVTTAKLNSRTNSITVVNKSGTVLASV